MASSADGIPRKFADKCKELGGIPDIEAETVFCHYLPSISRALELRNFVGEILRSEQGFSGFLRIEVPHENYTEIIYTEGGNVKNWFSHYVAF